MRKQQREVGRIYKKLESGVRSGLNALKKRQKKIGKNLQLKIQAK